MYFSDIKCYGLVVIKCGGVTDQKMYWSDKNSYGLVVMKCGGVTDM